MAISLQYGLKQSQKLVMTQAVKQGIELLQLSTLDLYDRIEHELIENPVIEEDIQKPTLGDDNSPISTNIDENLSWDNSNIQKNEENEIRFGETSDSGFTNSADSDKKRDYLESVVAKKETLIEHLLWQANLTALNQEELNIYQDIITRLDDKGFLSLDISAFSSENNCKEDTLKKIIESIQLFDPVGCCVENVRESLILQSIYYFPDDKILQSIISDYFIDLEKLNYEKIAKSLNISKQEVIQKNKIIQKTLDPFPGQQYSVKEIRYIMPDVEVKFIDENTIITLNDDWLPSLTINSYYLNYLKKKNIEKNLKEYIQDKVQAAKYLMKNISSRRDTILKVVKSIMEYQKEFLIKGPGNLKPLTHLEVAQEIDMHESTVSRVTSNKFVQTSWGVFELKYFFVSKLRSKSDENKSSDQVMNQIKIIIEQEDPNSPMSDEEIVDLLAKNDMEVARRTVAKYRNILNIPSSSKRKKLNKIKLEEK